MADISHTQYNTGITKKYHDNGDGTHSEQVYVGGEAALPAGTAIIGATKDAGPNQTVVRTYTASADLTTAAAITAAPASGQKIVLMDVLISVSIATVVTIEMETSANVLAGFHMPANSTLQITPRGWLKGDAADKKIFAKSTVAGAVKFTAVYFSEA